MRIFLDANILFSGALPNSRMGAFLDFLGKECELLANNYAMEEARRNLEAKYPEALRRLEPLMEQCELVTAVRVNLPVEIAAKDVPILGGAVAGQANYLLTGDERDFGKFLGRTMEGVKVVSPKLLAKELKEIGLL